MAGSVRDQRVVTLAAIDPPNLPPIFNAYCWAATLPLPAMTDDLLPTVAATEGRVVFPDAGLVVDQGPRHFTVVSVKKGGVVQHYVDGEEAVVDCGALYRRGDEIGSAQGFDDLVDWTIDGSTLTVKAEIRSVISEVPGPWQFAALRVASKSFLRVRRVREWVKRRLVARLITGPKRWNLRNVRTIELGPDLRISDSAGPGDQLQRVYPGAQFSAIHMASQGYWQIQDEGRG